jgi:hypothetical protein
VKNAFRLENYLPLWPNKTTVLSPGPGHENKDTEVIRFAARQNMYIESSEKMPGDEVVRVRNSRDAC